MKEAVKEFFHFLAKGRARTPVSSSIPTEEEIKEAAEAAHEDLVKKLDEIVSSQQGVRGDGNTPPWVEYRPKIDAPYNKPVYKLNQSQLDRLQTSVKIGDVAWMIPQPRPDDDKKLKDGLDQLNQEIVDLQALGLVKDVSELFRKKIEQAMKQYGRHVQYFATTRLAHYLFTEKEYYRDNEGDDKVRERIVQ